MITNEDRPNLVEDQKVDIEKIKCSNCNRELKFSRNWVGDYNHVLCEGCYQNLVFPFLKTAIT